MRSQYAYFKDPLKLIARSLVIILILTIISGTLAVGPLKVQSISTSGVDIAYEVKISYPVDPSIRIAVAYTNLAPQTKFTVGFPNWPYPTLSILKDIKFTSAGGTMLPWTKLDDKTIEVQTSETSVSASYAIDLSNISNVHQVAIKLEGIGGAISGVSAFLVPEGQKIDNVKVKFAVPEPWKVISDYREENGWFIMKPYTYEDLGLETKASGWYFGNIDFDYTKMYDDGYSIRVVGLKYFPYEHWNVYLNNTPLEEAIKTADFYHATYEKIKGFYGEYPLPPQLLVLGPGYWQSGNTYLRQQLVGQNRYEYIPHHMLHAFFQVRIDFANYFYGLLTEGYPTYSEGIMTAEIDNNPIWRGMLYERKFHYLRGKKFNNLEQNSRNYVLGFIITYLMDKEIGKETNNKKNINDLMVQIWQKYKGPNKVWVSDEQVLETLKELTGNDWHWFYDKYVRDTSNLDVNQLDDLKEDFKKFLKVEADIWYNGNQSAYFVRQEITSAIGDFDINVRIQNVDMTDFVLAARKYKDISKDNLTEVDIENILHQITGKEHSDFFEFYRSQGFDIDPKEITEYVKTFTYTMQGFDNAIKLIPKTFPLGKSTNVIGEIVDQDFTNSDVVLLQAQVYDLPIGLAKIQDLITGKGVSYQGSQEFSTCTNYFFKLPKAKIGDKTYIFFTIKLPMDAGVISYSFFGQPFENPPSDFIGLKKVKFQSGSTFRAKPNTYENIDNVPPIFSITEPDSPEITTQSKTLCIKGFVEPEAKVLVNGKEAVISSSTFEWSSCIELQPGENTIKIEVSDKASNTVIKEIKATLSDTLPPELVINAPLDNSETNEDTITVSGTATDKESGISKVTVNGIPASISSSGSFSTKLNLTEGINRITVLAIDNSGNQTTRTINVTYKKPAKTITIILQVGQTTFTVNGTSNTLDSPPIIKNGRTLLPIRPVVEALGGSVSWDGNEKKVTVTLGSTTIELWIGKNTARVNGVTKPIDSTNSKVVPEIINGRTMLPLRFVTENLGCTVQWDGSTQTITITYGG